MKGTMNRAANFNPSYWKQDEHFQLDSNNDYDGTYKNKNTRSSRKTK